MAGVHSISVSLAQDKKCPSANKFTCTDLTNNINSVYIAIVCVDTNRTVINIFDRKE